MAENKESGLSLFVWLIGAGLAIVLAVLFLNLRGPL
jgi:hypothetical protein